MRWVAREHSTKPIGVMRSHARTERREHPPPRRRRLLGAQAPADDSPRSLDDGSEARCRRVHHDPTPKRRPPALRRDRDAVPLRSTQHDLATLIERRDRNSIGAVNRFARPSREALNPFPKVLRRSSRQRRRSTVQGPSAGLRWGRNQLLERRRPKVAVRRCK